MTPREAGVSGASFIDKIETARDGDHWLPCGLDRGRVAWRGWTRSESAGRVFHMAIDLSLGLEGQVCLHRITSPHGQFVLVSCAKVKAPNDLAL